MAHSLGPSSISSKAKPPLLSWIGFHSRLMMSVYLRSVWRLEPVVVLVGGIKCSCFDRWATKGCGPNFKMEIPFPSCEMRVLRTWKFEPGTFLVCVHGVVIRGICLFLGWILSTSKQFWSPIGGGFSHPSSIIGDLLCWLNHRRDAHQRRKVIPSWCGICRQVACTPCVTSSSSDKHRECLRAPSSD